MIIKDFLKELMDWSLDKFIRGARNEEMLLHIEAKCKEAHKTGPNSDIWADIIILASEGMTRQEAAKNFVPATTSQTAARCADHLKSRFGRVKARRWPRREDQVKGEIVRPLSDRHDG